MVCYMRRGWKWSCHCVVSVPHRLSTDQSVETRDPCTGVIMRASGGLDAGSKGGHLIRRIHGQRRRHRVVGRQSQKRWEVPNLSKDGRKVRRYGVRHIA